MKVSIELQPCLKNKSGIGVYTYNIAKNLEEIKGIELYGEIFSFLGKDKLDENYKDLNIKLKMCKLFPYGVYRRIWSKLPLKYNTLLNSHSDIYHFFDYIVPPKISKLGHASLAKCQTLVKIYHVQVENNIEIKITGKMN